MGLEQMRVITTIHTIVTKLEQVSFIYSLAKTEDIMYPGKHRLSHRHHC